MEVMHSPPTQQETTTQQMEVMHSTPTQQDTKTLQMDTEHSIPTPQAIKTQQMERKHYTTTNPLPPPPLLEHTQVMEVTITLTNTAHTWVDMQATRQTRGVTIIQ